MSPRNSAYIQDIDRLIEQTSVEQVLTHFGHPAPTTSKGEHRMQCVFETSCHDSQYGNMTVKLDDPAHRIYCHSCGVRGNLLTLLHGMQCGTPPDGGRLRGNEFKAAVATLKDIAGQRASNKPCPPASSTVSNNDSPTPRRLVNVPLIRHEKEAAQNLADLFEELVTDVSAMSPEAASYVRARPWMTPELLKKWGVGWIPGNGRSLFRKNYLVYTHRNERSDVVSYSGRDVGFEAKWQKWINAGRPDGKKPNKHRFVSGFHRGSELFGGQAARLQETYVQESLEKHGIVVVEGMNDVLRLDTLGIAAVGLTSNKATDTQIETIARFARQAAANRVVLLPHCDEAGESGFQPLLWKLSEQRVQTRLAVSSLMFGGKFSGRQPEDFSEDNWRQIDEALSSLRRVP